MIVTAAEVCAHLKLEGTDPARDALLEGLSQRVEAAFLAQAGRADRPYLPAETAPITELVDGTGGDAVFTRRPIGALTSVTVDGRTIAAADLAFRVGNTMIRSRDGSVFGKFEAADAVSIVYTPAAEAPFDVHLVILRAVAAIYLQRGAEDVRAESEGGIRSEFASAFEDPVWRMTVQDHREVRVG